MTQRIPPEERLEQLLTLQLTYQVSADQHDDFNQLKQQILDDAKKAELYDNIQNLTIGEERTELDKQNSKIVDEIKDQIRIWKNVIDWEGNIPKGLDVMDRIEEILKDNEK